MGLSNWWYSGFRAFVETANLVALALLCVASYLTNDWLLFGIGIAIELVYLVWRSRSPHYRTQLEERAQSGRRVGDPLDALLVVITITGFLVILFFGFGKHLLDRRFPYLTHAEGWEAGAIVWTGLFFFFYLVKLRATDSVFVDKFVVVIIAFVGTGLLVLAWNSMGRWATHIPFVMGIGLCFLIMDWLGMRFHPEKIERMVSRNSLIWAHVPMIITLSVLWAYLLMHRDTENPEVLVPGLISCQLLISNTAFVVMELGLLQPPR